MKVELGDPMDIYFCDLCNESVPLVDLRDGRAVRRKDRVVCATCEAAMSAHLSSAAATAPENAPAPAGAVAASPHARPAPAAAGRRGSGTAIALVALVFSAGASAFLYVELAREREAAAQAQERTELQLARLGDGGARLLALLDARTAELERSLRAAVEAARGELSGQVLALRADLAETGGRLLEQDARMLELKSETAERGEELGRRLDELAAQLARSRQDAGLFAERFAALEQLVQSGGRAPVAAGPAAEAPRPGWHPALRDLASENVGTRWNAVQTLGESGDAAVVPHLVGMLEDPDVFVRMAVVRVFGDLGAPTVIEPLIDALEDDDAAVRESAMISLRAITGRDFKFDAMASPADRSRKVKLWRQWWAKAKDDYLGGTGEGP